MKSVTDRQGVEFARMARARNVPRGKYENARRNGTLGLFLDAIRDGKLIQFSDPLLVPVGSHAVVLAERHDPDAYYRTREGLYVWDNFRNNVVAKAKPMEAGMTRNIASADLVRDLTDAEIESALPTDHLLNETVLCAVIAGLVAKQAKGEEGALLNNGYANLFYTSSVVVDVRWIAADRKWYVFAYVRGDCRWDAGRRVFSSATAA